MTTCYDGAVCGTDVYVRWPVHGSTMRQDEGGERDQRSDDALVAAFQSGADRAGAVAALFRRYGAQTQGFFARRVGQADVAADLNQSLYLSVVKGLAGFRREASFRTWLFRLAHNELNRLRRRWHTHLDEQPAEVSDEFWADLAAGGDRPDRAAERGQLRRALSRCLAGLDETQRAVVLGQYVERVTLKQLTARLGLSNPSGARATLLTAQRRLRRCLENAGFTGAA